MGTQRTQSALLCSNLLDSHCQTDGIATDICRKYTNFFIYKKSAKKSALLSVLQEYNLSYAKTGIERIFVVYFH
jgi:hypothetical protein